MSVVSRALLSPSESMVWRPRRGTEAKSRMGYTLMYSMKYSIDMLIPFSGHKSQVAGQSGAISRALQPKMKGYIVMMYTE